MTDTDFSPIVGHAYDLEDGLRMVLAPNPSPMTYLGTNTYLLGKTRIAVIDPGPDSEAHLNALLRAIGSATVSHIIVTHNHLDHSPLAARLSEQVSAPVYAFGTHLEGRSAVMDLLAKQGLSGGGEGIDMSFIPDIILSDRQTIGTDEWTLTALHTPGHIGNHLSLIWDDAIFTGDHVMGWASSLVSPPDGDLTDFMLSCEKLQQIPARIYYAGHGAPINVPKARLTWLIAHRKSREAQILAALGDQPATVQTLTRDIYTDVPMALLPAAERNVFAHLVDLHQRRHVAANPDLSQHAIFKLL
ncbi:MBL fold metallo-hydrolase [Yoonia sp. MH D7]